MGEFLVVVDQIEEKIVSFLFQNTKEVLSLIQYFQTSPLWPFLIYSNLLCLFYELFPLQTITTVCERVYDLALKIF